MILLSSRTLGIVSFLALAGASSAQGEFRMDIDQGASAWTWSGNTTVGPLVGSPNQNFNLSGTIDLDLEGGANPISSGQIVESNALVVPDLVAYVPNPIPGFPNLADVNLNGLRFSLSTSSFTVDASGSFTTVIDLVVLSGTLIVDPLTGSTSTQDLTGTTGVPTTITGSIIQTGNSLRLDAPQSTSFSFTDTATGITGDLNINGTVIADFVCPPAANFCSTSANSAGGPAAISVSGSSSVSANNLMLSAAPVPNQPGIFFYSQGQTGGGAGVPFGNGTRCVGNGANPIVRLGVAVASGNVIDQALDIANPPGANGQITVGSTWYFQAWFRDPAAGGAAFNLSDGIGVFFCP